MSMELSYSLEWFAGTKTGNITLVINFETRDLRKAHDTDSIVGIHQFYLGCLVIQQNGEFVSNSYQQVPRNHEDVSKKYLKKTEVNINVML